MYFSNLTDHDLLDLLSKSWIGFNIPQSSTLIALAFSDTPRINIPPFLIIIPAYK